MKIKMYSVETIRPDKRPAIWAHVEPNKLVPLAYLQRPKWLSDEQWERVIEAVRIDATAELLE